ncbi:MAG: NPCBM/NEW2 domain-containing protein [Lachnospiraceae bacterium]|nr:NPCBM/NEW2 domain-containing protein [Lachnospiraceae bacterium]
MKIMKRFLCALLAAIMTAGLIVPAMSSTAYADARVLTNIGKAGSTVGKSAHAVASSINYLSDLYSTDRKVSSFVIGLGASETAPRDFKLDTNWDGKVFVWTGSSDNGSTARRVVDNTNSPRVLTITKADNTTENVTYKRDEIAIGYRGTKYAKGLGGLVSASNKKPATVIYDLQGLDADYFYAVAGITGEGNVNPATDKFNYKLTFNVYGSKTGTESEDFELLTTAKEIRAYLTAEFNTNINGYKYLKLETLSDGTNAGGSFVWADACLYQTERTSVTITTVWDDAGKESYRPTSFELQLLADGTPYGDPVTVDASTDYGYTFPSVPKYGTGESAVKYTATATILNYDSTFADGVLTNKFTPETSFQANVIWDDMDNAFKTRPAELKAELMADGAATGKVATLTAEGGWKYRWEHIPIREEGASTPISYSVKVKSTPEFYDFVVSGNTITATSTYDPAAQTVSYTTEVLWVDEEGTRPASLDVQLYADGALEGAPTTITGSGSSWTHTWEGLAKHKNGTDPETVEYSAVITNLPAEYAAVYSGKRIWICTFHTLVDFDLKVIWDDMDNEPGIRPASLQAQLTSNGTNEGAPVTINEDNSWSYTWPNLPVSSAGTYTKVTGSYRGATEVADGAQVTQLSSLNIVESYNNNGAASTVNYPYAGNSTDPFIIGEDNTKFTSGIGVHPQMPSKNGGEAWTVYDVSKLNADRFYAAVGITNSNGKNGASKGVVFKVFGDYGDGSYVQLASSDTILKKDTGEFSVGISGVKKLKLSVFPAGTDNYSCGSAWVNACVYKSTSVCGPMANYSVDFTGLPEEYEVSFEGTTATLSYVPKKDYSVSVVWSDNNDQMKQRPGYVTVRAYLDKKPSDYTVRVKADEDWKATIKLPIYRRSTTEEVTYSFSQDPVPEFYSQSVSGGKITNRYNPNLPGQYIPSSTGAYKGANGVKENSLKYLSDMEFTESSNTGGKPASINAPYGTTVGKLLIGAKDTNFSMGLGVHPADPKATTNYSWTDYDLSGMNVDRFYAVVGLTASKGKDGASLGTLFRVYAEYSDGSEKLLAQSEIITKKKSGEFLVDISGAKKLHLVVLSTGENHYSSACAWANACVFKYDKNGKSFSGNQVVLPGKYTPNTSGNYTTTVKAAKGSVKFLSDLKYTESSNTTSKEYPNGKPTNLDHPYGENGDIIIGKKAQKIKKGLGVHPKPASSTNGSWTTYDLSKLNVDRFYAVVGITNENGKEGKCEPIYFRVYADYGDGKLKLLAESENISKKMTGEFDVDIKGVKKLKLMVLATGSHSSCGSVWGNACVYKYSKNGSVKIHTNNSTLNYLLNYKASKGDYTEDLKAKEGSVTFLSKIDNTGSSNTTNDKYPKGQPTNYNHPYGSMQTIAKIGQNNQYFYTGLGMHPKNPLQPINGSIESWTTYDLREMDVDRFYAAVGITNSKGKEGASKGVIFRVYADFGSGYKLIGQSDIITGYMSGEFDLNISGAQFLKVAMVSAKKTHASSASFFANACVYKYDAAGSVHIHTNHIGDKIPITPHPTDNYYPSADGTYQGLPMEYDKNSVFITKLDYLESSNTQNEIYPYGQPSTIDHPYGKPEEVICIGEQEALFFEGLGMHPKNPALPVDNSIESYTIYDISELGADRFYSAVGITNSNGKAGKSPGVIFRIYGDYGDGKYVKIGESENITKKMSGEFMDVDISGVKLLKLVVVCGGTAHTSSASAWAGASFYSTTGALHLPEKPVRPTKDAAEEETPADETTSAAEESGAGLGTGAIIGIAAGSVAVIGGATAAIIIGGKKRGKDDKDDKAAK